MTLHISHGLAFHLHAIAHPHTTEYLIEADLKQDKAIYKCACHLSFHTSISYDSSPNISTYFTFYASVSIYAFHISVCYMFNDFAMFHISLCYELCASALCYTFPSALCSMPLLSVSCLFLLCVLYLCYMFHTSLCFKFVLQILIRLPFYLCCVMYLYLKGMYHQVP